MSELLWRLVISFSICALLTLPGSWISLRYSAWRGVVVGFGVYLTATIMYTTVPLIQNMRSYGFWVPALDDTRGENPLYHFLYAVAVGILYWAPVQLIGIVAASLLRRRRLRRFQD